MTIISVTKVYFKAIKQTYITMKSILSNNILQMDVFINEQAHKRVSALK